jgi:heme/copper-type cytochrome/quinol oxidase subunit 2
MRVVILAMCALFAGAVFVTIFLATWSSRRASDRGGHFHQSAVIEFVWVAIPCLMVIAAAIPAAIAIMARAAGN